MKIATWNVERPTLFCKTVPAINSAVREIGADILILTETNDCISPGLGYASASSFPLDPSRDGYPYAQGEWRVSIYSRYPIEKRLVVTNPHTTACALIATPRGSLAVFGCIIGILGNRDEGFNTDLQDQARDLSVLAQQGHQICFAGDFNLTFCDTYYPNAKGKQVLEESFSKLGIEVLTADIGENIDHIAFSKSFLSDAIVETNCWNEDKTLSDHKGVSVRIQWGERNGMEF